MKKALLCLLFVFVTTAANAQFKAGAMLPSVDVKFSGLGFSYGASFEFGLTDKIGAKATADMTSYTAGSTDWSIVGLDVAGTYHLDGSKYGLLGVTYLINSADGLTGKKSGGTFGIVGGAGYTYKINDRLVANGEGSYRVITLEAGSYKATVSWYRVGVGLAYVLN